MDRAGEYITIHVCDEARKIERDFKVEKKQLLREMKYFEAYLTSGTKNDEIDISVHCDVHIFDWLIQYMQRDCNIPPKLG